MERDEDRAEAVTEDTAVLADDELVEALRVGIITPEHPDPVLGALAWWREELRAGRLPPR